MRTTTISVLALLASGVGLWLWKQPRLRLGSPGAQIQPAVAIASKSLAPSTGPDTNFTSQQKQTSIPTKIRTATNTSGASVQTASSGSEAPVNDSPKRLAWETNFLARLRDDAEGNPIRFPLPGGRTAFGKIGHLQRNGGEVLYVSGQLSEPEAGRFFLQRQTMPGVAGDFVGVVELPASRRAYRLEPTGPAGASEWVERPLG